MGKHVIVISEDALIYEDTATLEQLPVFGSIWKKAARVEQVRSIYPTPHLPLPYHDDDGLLSGSSRHRK